MKISLKLFSSSVLTHLSLILETLQTTKLQWIQFLSKPFTPQQGPKSLVRAKKLLIQLILTSKITLKVSLIKTLSSCNYFSIRVNWTGSFPQLIIHFSCLKEGTHHWAANRKVITTAQYKASDFGFYPNYICQCKKGETLKELKSMISEWEVKDDA